MGGQSEPQVEPGVPDPTAGTMPTGTPAPASSDVDPLLTKEAWEGVLRVPFKMLAEAVQAPGVAEIGRKRARDLAKPSYVIFEHYAKEYLAMSPDNPLSFAWVATALVGIDIAGDVGMEIARARAGRKAAELPGPPEGMPVNQAA